MNKKTICSRNTCELYFHNLSYEVRGKTILNNISGKFSGGALIGILGPSGSGKTTLLNILSGYRYQNAKCKVLQINDVDTKFECLQSISSYIRQDINLNDLLSIEENMQFAADFKLSATHSKEEKTAIIDELLNAFGLYTVKSTRTSYISGGERKRLSIAMELIDDPYIIYLDEPTTGLDISTTRQILEYLKKLAKSGKTVVCTIHQVCALHFELFDNAYVVTNGQCAYNGSPKDLVTFLDQIGMPCNIYNNPADYVIELCCGDYGTDKGTYLIQASRNGKHNIEQTNAELSSTERCTIDQLFYSNTSWNYQFRTLVRREFVKMRRNWLLTYARLIGSNAIGLAIGLLYWNVGQDASHVITNFKLVLAMNANLILTGLLYPILSFPLEMEIVKIEVYNKYYSILQYYITIILLDLPISLFTIVSSNMLMYYLTGQVIEAERIGLFIIFSIAMGTVINVIGFFFGTLLKLQNAIFFGSILQLPIMVISGFTIMFQDLHWFVNEISLLMYPRNGIQGTLVVIFGLSPRSLHCSEEEIYCYYKNTHRFLQDIGVDPYEYYYNLYVIIIWIVAVRIITYYSMKYRISL